MKTLVGLGFNIAVAVVLYFFGVSLTTCWFTFLIFCGLLILGELSNRLNEIEQNLETIAAAQAKSEGWTNTQVHALGRIENRLDSIL